MKKEIDFKEGAVCFAEDTQRGANCTDVKSGLVVGFEDFQLNIPKEGWYMERSEICSYQDFEKFILVAHDFGFNGGINTDDYDHCDHGVFVFLNAAFKDCIGHIGSFKPCLCRVKVSFHQLMVISELKRKKDTVDLVEAMVSGPFTDAPQQPLPPKNPPPMPCFAIGVDVVLDGDHSVIYELLKISNENQAAALMNKENTKLCWYGLSRLSLALTKEQLIAKQIESKIHSKLNEFDFDGTVGVGDMASMICSDLMVDYKVTEHGE